jgi:hypothetical protein
MEGVILSLFTLRNADLGGEYEASSQKRGSLLLELLSKDLFSDLPEFVLLSSNDK